MVDFIFKDNATPIDWSVPKMKTKKISSKGSAKMFGYKEGREKKPTWKTKVVGKWI